MNFSNASVLSQGKSINFTTRNKEWYIISLPGLAIFLFTLCTLLVFAFPSYIGTYKYLALLVVLSSMLLMFNNIHHNLYIGRLGIFWILSLAIMALSIREWDTESAGNIIIYGSGILFLVGSKTEVKNYRKAILLIKVAAIIFALTIIMQYVYIDEYMRYIYPLFTENAKISLDRTLPNHRYAGITHHVAFAGGYIASGIGIIFSFWILNDSRIQKIKGLIYMSILAIGLLLTGSRSSMVFVCFVLFITYYFSSTGIEKRKRARRIVIIIIALSLMTFYAINNLPSLAFFDRLAKTLLGFLKGEDVSNGRLILYRKAWELFITRPVLGIGWGEFFKKNEGILLTGVKSPVHNVYLQLLCETGIIGFTIFMVSILGTYRKTFRLLKLVVENDKPGSKRIKPYILFSFYMQTLFLLDCLIGNPLYNYDSLLMYLIACSISVVVENYRKARGIGFRNIKWIEKSIV